MHMFLIRLKMQFMNNNFLVALLQTRNDSRYSDVVDYKALQKPKSFEMLMQTKESEPNKKL